MSDEAPLKGIKALRVYATFQSLDGEEDADKEAAMESHIEEGLREAGIQVLPRTDPVTFPLLRVTVAWSSVTPPDPLLYRSAYYYFTYGAELRELFPVPREGSKGDIQRATTWSTRGIGLDGQATALSMPSVSAKNILEDFIRDWNVARKQN